MTADLIFSEGSTSVDGISVTYHGDNGWCAGCVEVEKRVLVMEKKMLLMKKEIQFTRVRNRLAKMTALVYEQISFYDVCTADNGQSASGVNKCGNKS